MASKQGLKRIVTAIQRLYPKELADSSWDNTGLILGAALDDYEGSSPEKLKVLLAIDLTSSVCDEAINKKYSTVIAYHPFIFRGLKSITTNDPQQTSLLKLARAGISVYCPHTAVDAASGGVNDWLIDILTNGNESSREPIQPNKQQVEGHETGGMGRKATLKNPEPVNDVISRAKKALGLKYVQVAYAPKHKSGEQKIRSVAVCAGAGSGVLNGVDADLHFTGELHHHDLLYLKETGRTAVVCNHSNTERGFLKTIQAQLLEELKKSHDGQVEVDVSETDQDPLELFLE